jgi:hypothetical protein
MAACDLGGIVSRHQTVGPQGPLDPSVRDRRRV